MSEREVLIGKRRIAAYMHVSPRTVDRWRRERGFPVANLPNGRVATTTGLIDGWLLVRHEFQERQRAQ